MLCWAKGRYRLLPGIELEWANTSCRDRHYQHLDLDVMQISLSTNILAVLGWAGISRYDGRCNSSTIVLQVLPSAMSWQRATVTMVTVETHRLSDIWSTKIQESRTQEANRSYQPCACLFTCGRIHYGRLAPLRRAGDEHFGTHGVLEIVSSATIG